MTEQESELMVQLVGGHRFIAAVRKSPHAREGFVQVDEIIAKGATETRADGTWTRYAPHMIESVTCQPKGTGVDSGGETSSKG